MRSDVEMQS
jgi:hypothetical protein